MGGGGKRERKGKIWRGGREKEKGQTRDRDGQKDTERHTETERDRERQRFNTQRIPGPSPMFMSSSNDLFTSCHFHTLHTPTQVIYVPVYNDHIITPQETEASQKMSHE